MTDIFFVLTVLIFSFCFTFILMPFGIRLLRKYKFGKNIRDEGLAGKAENFCELHSKKQGTPTMGGLIILVSLVGVILISIVVQWISPWLQSYFGFGFSHSLWNRRETYLVVFTLISMGIVGMLDDYLNIRGIGRTKGLSAWTKLALLSLFALIGALWFFFKLEYRVIHIPFLGEMFLGWIYIPIFIFIVIAAANSVNITDGLDGLAGGLLLFQFLSYGVITYLRGQFILSALCMVIVGILFAFLWFNIHPAQVFMGDTGSLSLGATLAILAFLTDTLVAFMIMSSIFIFETFSVILQMLSKKFRNGKKIFLISPFHHHLEMIGWKEETIVMRFWVLGMILAIIGIIVAISATL